jgi:thymidylate synthase ThyX
MFEAKVLADSISPAGHRLTSFEVTFPRIVLAELNTHCMLSRNSASSRAIPVEKRIAAIRADMFVPEEFGRNQKGMQPGAALEGDAAGAAREIWQTAGVQALAHAEWLAAFGVHKQYANRLTEPFAWHTAVVTATDWANFFHLRVNPMAQGELCKAAELMQSAMGVSEPRPIDFEEWHLPYVDPSEAFNLEDEGIDVAKVSAARCARVSYLMQNGVRDSREDVALYDRLVSSGHMSPLEHVARPMSNDEIELTRTFDVSFKGGPMLRTTVLRDPKVGFDKVTAVRGPLNYCGKLNGWVSRRAHVPGEWDILGHREVST